MILVYDGLGFSFKKITNLVERGLREIGYKQVFKVDGHTGSFQHVSKAVIIADTILAIKWCWIERYLPHTDKLVLWTDTPLSLRHIVDKADLINDNCCNYVTLPCFIDVFKEFGIKVHGYIPRPIDVDTAEKVYREASCKDLWEKYGDYVITVAGDQIIMPPKKPRKGLDMYDKLCEYLKKFGIRCLAVSNWIYFKNVHRINFGSLPEEELLRLVKCSKLFVWTSRGEGFGLPPLEAMAVGQLVVASNNPTNELIAGIKFDYSSIEEVYMPEINCYYVCYDYDFRDLLDAVNYALDIDEDERAKYIEFARREAKKYHPRYISQLLVEV